MLVKINGQYKGVYGHYDRELGTVTAKRAGDPPFSVAPEVARRHILNGVLIAVTEEAEAPVKTAPGKTAGARTEADKGAQETVQEAVTAAAEKSVEDMTFPELREAAKERGIASFGKKRTDLIALIKAHDEAAVPVFSAEDAVV